MPLIKNDLTTEQNVIIRLTPAQLVAAACQYEGIPVPDLDAAEGDAGSIAYIKDVATDPDTGEETGYYTAISFGVTPEDEFFQVTFKDVEGA